MSDLNVEDKNGVAVLRFIGPLSASEVVKLEPAFRKAAMASSKRIVVDLSGVQLLATPALTMFLGALNFQRANGGKVVFTGTQGAIDKLLHVCKLDLIMTIVPDPQAALEKASQ